MTYEELRQRLTKCEVKLQEFKQKDHPARKSKNFDTAVKKLTVLKESLENQIKEIDSDKVILTTKTGRSYVAGMDKQSARDLFRGEDDIEVSDEEGNELNEDGVKFTQEETAAIAREVGKAVAKALHSLGDEVAHMKAKDLEPNSFEIYVQYKNDSDDQFSFYITDDTLHLQDFSFDKEIGDVGVKPSGEAIVHVDVLANELQKHFKSLAAEGMSDQEYADAKEAERLEKHPEKDTIKKIQALIAAQQKKEGMYIDDEEWEKEMGRTPEDTEKAIEKEKAKLKGEATKEELEEDINLHKIEVSIRDAKKAQDIMYDMYDHQFEQNGSNVYLFDDEQTAYDAMMDLTTRGIEVENIEDFDDIEEGIHDLDITSSPVGHIKNTSKQDQAYSDSNKAQRKRYTDDEWDKLTNPLRRYSRFNENEAEDQGGDLDIGHQDDEPDMLKQQVYDIATYAAKLYKALDKYDQMDAEVDFPNWWQSKVILARDYISSAQHYLEFEEKQPAIDALALEESVNESHAKLKREYDELVDKYDELVGKMKQLAKHFKTAEGEKKAKIVAALKQHTARKRELEGLINQVVAGIGAGQELEVNEAKATCCGKCGRVHVKGTECKRPFLTGKDHCRYN